MSTFLRRNGRSLLALPLLLVLAVGASGQRMVDLWWPEGMTDRVDTDAEGTARFETVADLQTGLQRQRISVRLVEVEPTDRMPMAADEEAAVPPGFRAVRVRVHVETDPGTVLSTCQVLLRDDAGATYPAGTAIFDDGLTDLASCQPRDVENPSGFLVDARRPSTRPPAFDRDAVFVLPDGARPTAVRVSPDLHLYAEWALPAGS